MSDEAPTQGQNGTPNADATQAAQVTPPAVVAPVTPQNTGNEDLTKKFSDLHNANKALTEQVATLTKQVTAQADTGKNAEQLQAELATSRTAADASKTELDAFNTDMKDMVKKAEEGLTDEQKKQLEFSSEDPFK